MVVIVILKAFDASLTMKLNPGLILRVSNSSVISMKSHIIYLSLLFFVGVVRVTLKSYTHMM